MTDILGNEILTGDWIYTPYDDFCLVLKASEHRREVLVATRDRTGIPQSCNYISLTVPEETKAKILEAYFQRLRK